MVKSTLSLGDWIRERSGWTSLRDELSTRTVDGGNVTAYLGGAALMLMALQVASGALLLLHYEPSSEHAHESVVRITGQLPFGDLLRGIHIHSGTLLIGVVAVILLGILLKRSYVAPREFTWLSGIALLLLCVAMAFTGGLLPWSHDAYLQARVGSQMASYMPLVGEWLRRFLRGGEEVTTLTLQRAFGFHVAVLPATLTLVLALHLNMLRAANAADPNQQSTSRIPIYPDFLIRLAAVGVAVLALVISLATFVEPTIGDRANPAAAISGSEHPGWYLLFVHELLRLAPAKLLGLDSPEFIGGALSALLVLILAVPFLDRRGSRVTSGLAVVLAGLGLLLTVHALL